MEKSGKPSTRAKNKYNAKAYDSLRIVVPKGQKKAIGNHAKRKGLSINSLVSGLLQTDMGLTDEEWKNPSKEEELAL